MSDRSPRPAPAPGATPAGAPVSADSRTAAAPASPGAPPDPVRPGGAGVEVQDALGYEQLRARHLDGARSGDRVVIDLSGKASLSGAEAAALLRVIIEGRGRGVTVRLGGASPGARQAFAGLGAEILAGGGGAPEPVPLVEKIGEETIGVYDLARRVIGLIGELFHWTLIAPFRGGGKAQGIKWERTIQQVLRVGYDGVPIVSFLSFLIGTVLALNGASQLRQFGAAIYIADLVGVAMTREMGPLITAIIVAGRSGSAITAELGTMVVAEEIDAMRTMALAPGRFLLVPRVLALCIAMPCLTVVANLTGIFGGYWIGVILLQLGARNYVDETAQALLVSDVMTGLVKSAVFALIIGLVACYRGFYVRGGAEEVGTSTTSSVVTSIVLCIVANAVFTTIFYYVK